MKQSYIILILIAFMGVSCSRSEVILTEDQLPEDIFYLQDEIKPYTGKCIIYYTNTEVVKEEFNFEKGILNGDRISYFKNGNIKRIGQYNKGMYNGVWKVYNEKGAQTMEVAYKNDTLWGDFVSWHPTGVISEKGLYHNNKKAGSWYQYDEAGMLLSKRTI